MIRDLSQEQFITFPFSVDRLAIEIRDIRRHFKERDFVLILSFRDTNIQLPWSETLGSYFQYFPSAHVGDTATIESTLGAEVRSFGFKVIPWSSTAKGWPTNETFSSLAIRGQGIAGEELRRYEVDYVFQLTSDVNA